MNIDFTEIPLPNKGGKEQDIFELFACDFLESLGYEIVQRPSRGPDGKKDLIILSNSVPGITSDSKTKWLVSCKHKAHSGNGVSDVDEPDISDRVKKHKCHGFIGFYSTIPNSTLSEKLKTYSNQFIHTLYDHSRIEKEIHSLKDKERILVTYFPKSRDKWDIDKHRIKDLSQQSVSEEENNICKYRTPIVNESLLEVTRTALIQIEIAKIKHEFTYDWSKSEDLFNKFYIYVDFRNEIIARDVLSFLNIHVSSGARSQMPSSVASSIFGLVLTYFSSSFGEGEEDSELRIENGKECIYSGFHLAYDALIYSGNYRVAEWGLSIWKFIYRESKRKGHTELTDLVLKKYEELEQTLNRPERNDLENAKELVKIFKDNLETYDLSFPVLPEHLYKLVKQFDCV